MFVMVNMVAFDHPTGSHLVSAVVFVVYVPLPVNWSYSIQLSIAFTSHNIAETRSMNG